MKSPYLFQFYYFLMLLLCFAFSANVALAQDECEGYEVELFISGTSDLEGEIFFISNAGIEQNHFYYGGDSTYVLCLETDCYNIQVDVITDEDGGYWEIFYGDTVIGGGFIGPQAYFVTVGIEGGCAGSAIFGCTDPAALNYNPEATFDNGSCIYDGEPCNFEVLTNAISCGVVHMTAFSPGTWVTWTVNGESIPTLPSSSLTYYFDGPGSYEFCATQNITECEMCATVLHQLECDGECDDLSFVFLNGDEPYPGIAWFEATYDGDLGDGILLFDSGTGSPASISYDSFFGYQYAPGTYEVCFTFYGSDCVTTTCDTIVIGPMAVYGCTDPSALNYNPDATVDNGSCLYGDCSISFTVLPDTNGLDVLYILPTINIFEASEVFWDFGDGNSSNELFPFHLYEGNGPYDLCLYATFEIEGEDDCVAVYCMEIDESLLGRSSGFAIQVIEPATLGNVVSPFAERLKLWPNPTREQLYLGYDAPQAELLEMRIFDLSGRMLESRQLPVSPGSNQFEINSSQWKAGMYLVQLSGAQMSHSLRFVVSD